MKFHGNFIGNDEAVYIGLSSGGDSPDRCANDALTQPDDWYYKNVLIDYRYNKFGHRSKNLEDINLSNYILFAGCSHTEGVGLELEKTFPYITSDILQCDYYNLALGATGIDVLLFNLVAWFSTIKQLPKCVVIQWPDQARFVSIEHNSPNIVPIGPWTTDKNFQASVIADHNNESATTRAILAKKLIEIVIPCPIKYITVRSQKLPGDMESGISFVKVDVARDLAHFGIKSNEILATKLANSIKTIQ